MIAKKGASITDRSNGSLAVVDIEDSHSVTVQGSTINGGARGISCSTASVCYLTGNTLQGRDGGFGVNVVRGSRAFLESNVIQNWARAGHSSTVVRKCSAAMTSSEAMGGAAIVVINRSYFESLDSSLDNNGFGIEAGGACISQAGLSAATPPTA